MSKPMMLNMTQGFKHIHEMIKRKAQNGQLTITEAMKKENELLGALAWWRKQVFKAKNDFEGPSLAAALHAIFDMVRGKADEDDPIGVGMVTCKANCNACCRIRVAALKQEAELLAHRVVHGGLEIDRKRLELQATNAHSLEDHRSMDMDDRMCVFNGPDGNCRVYENRPLACRNYRVLSEPKACETSRVNPVQVKIEPNTEALITAAFTELGTGPLPELLLSEIERLEAEKAAAEAGQGARPTLCKPAPEAPPAAPDDPSSTPGPASL